MARLRNDVVDGFLEVARSLAAAGGTSVIGQASRRRAVSTAYYAVFHALCHVCADTLVGAGRRPLRESNYRTLEHGSTRKLLVSAEARAISEEVAKVGADFAPICSACGTPPIIGPHSLDSCPVRRPT